LTDVSCITLDLLFREGMPRVIGRSGSTLGETVSKKEQNEERNGCTLGYYHALANVNRAPYLYRIGVNLAIRTGRCRTRPRIGGKFLRVDIAKPENLPNGPDQPSLTIFLVAAFRFRLAPYLRYRQVGDLIRKAAGQRFERFFLIGRQRAQLRTISRQYFTPDAFELDLQTEDDPCFLYDDVFGCFSQFPGHTEITVRSRRH
jgi:hypothetical protein